MIGFCSGGWVSGVALVASGVLPGSAGPFGFGRRRRPPAALPRFAAHPRPLSGLPSGPTVTSRPSESIVDRPTIAIDVYRRAFGTVDRPAVRAKQGFQLGRSFGSWRSAAPGTAASAASRYKAPGRRSSSARSGATGGGAATAAATTTSGGACRSRRRAARPAPAIAALRCADGLGCEGGGGAVPAPRPPMTSKPRGASERMKAPEGHHRPAVDQIDVILARYACRLRQELAEHLALRVSPSSLCSASGSARRGGRGRTAAWRRHPPALHRSPPTRERPAPAPARTSR